MIMLLFDDNIYFVKDYVANVFYFKHFFGNQSDIAHRNEILIGFWPTYNLEYDTVIFITVVNIYFFK